MRGRPRRRLRSARCPAREQIVRLCPTRRPAPRARTCAVIVARSKIRHDHRRGGSVALEPSRTPASSLPVPTMCQWHSLARRSPPLDQAASAHPRATFAIRSSSRSPSISFAIGTRCGSSSRTRHRSKADQTTSISGFEHRAATEKYRSVNVIGGRPGARNRARPRVRSRTRSPYRE